MIETLAGVAFIVALTFAGLLALYSPGSRPAK